MIGKITFSKVQDPLKWDIPDSIEFPSAEAARAAEETVNKAIVEAYEQGRIAGLKEAVEIVRAEMNGCYVYGVSDYDAEREQEYISMPKEIVDTVVQKILHKT